MGEKAFIYCRISQDKAGSEYGVKRQEEDCRELAEAKGFDVVEVFVDNDISAYSGKHRPGYRAMLEGLRQGGAEVVVCWHTDRLHRSPTELEEYIKVCEPGEVATHTVKAGSLNLASGPGRMVARMLGAAASYESEMKSTRVKRKMEELARQGKWTGGYRPFGWNIVDGVPSLDPVEAAAVERLHHEMLDGRSLGAMARSLNEEGLVSSRGNKFIAVTVRSILLRSRNAGLAIYQGDVVGPSDFPAIVSEDVHRAVVSLITDAKRGPSHTNKPKYLMVGIAQCQCGNKVITSYTPNRDGVGVPVYRCPTLGAGHVSKSVKHVDDIVNVHMVVHRRRAAHRERSRDGDAESMALEVEVMALRERLNEAAMMASNGAITMAQLGVMSGEVRGRLLVAENRLTELALVQDLPDFPPSPMAGDVAITEMMEWMELPIDDRRDFVRRVCNVIFLKHLKGSYNTFDRDAVQVVPKTRSSSRGLLPVSEIEGLIGAWIDVGILPADYVARLGVPKPIEGAGAGAL